MRHSTVIVTSRWGVGQLSRETWCSPGRVVAGTAKWTFWWLNDVVLQLWHHSKYHGQENSLFPFLSLSLGNSTLYFIASVLIKSQFVSLQVARKAMVLFALLNLLTHWLVDLTIKARSNSCTIGQIGNYFIETSRPAVKKKEMLIVLCDQSVRLFPPPPTVVSLVSGVSRSSC